MDFMFIMTLFVHCFFFFDNNTYLGAKKNYNYYYVNK